MSLGNVGPARVFQREEDIVGGGFAGFVQRWNCKSGEFYRDLMKLPCGPLPPPKQWVPITKGKGQALWLEVAHLGLRLLLERRRSKRGWLRRFLCTVVGLLWILAGLLGKHGIKTLNRTGQRAALLQATQPPPPCSLTLGRHRPALADDSPVQAPMLLRRAERERAE